MIFWLVLKLEICIEFIIYLEKFWFLLEEFFFGEDYIFFHGEIFEFP
jgi:hypothetical protein